jgi:hypothetical protein
MPDNNEDSGSSRREIEDLIRQEQEEHMPQDRSDGLHSYVKLAITYMGLMIAFVIIGLVYYSVYVGYVNRAAATAVNLGYYIVLLIMPTAAIVGLIGRKKFGAYCTYGALAVSLSLFFTIPNSPVGQPAGEIPINVIVPLLIPHTIVGLLLFKAQNTLR